MAIEGRKYSQEYLNGINDVLRNRMDGNQDGQKDGKVTVQEAYNDLDIGSLLVGQNKQDSAKIKAAAQNIEQVLKQYAGNDGIFQAEEWASFLNGKEWGAVLDAWHSSGKKAELEMGWIDNSKGMIPDGQVTKGEVKVGLLNNLQNMNLPLMFDKQGIGSRLEMLVDKYAGKDGTFTVEEYTAMKNDPEYKQITNDIHLVPFGTDRRDNSDSDFEFAKSLPKNPDAKETTLQVGHGAKKIKGYSAKNPATGEIVYADQNGRRFTKEAFENWEQFAKDGTFVH